MVRSVSSRHHRREYSVTMQDPKGYARMAAPLHIYHVVATSEAKARGLAMEKWAKDDIHRTYTEPPRHLLTVEGESHLSSSHSRHEED